MQASKGMHCVSIVLLIIGGLNWLAIGAFKWGIGNISDSNGWMWTVRIIYILVGLAALYEIFTHKSSCRMCGSGTNMGGGM